MRVKLIAAILAGIVVAGCEDATKEYAQATLEGEFPNPAERALVSGFRDRGDAGYEIYYRSDAASEGRIKTVAKNYCARRRSPSFTYATEPKTIAGNDFSPGMNHPLEEITFVCRSKPVTGSLQMKVGDRYLSAI